MIIYRSFQHLYFFGIIKIFKWAKIFIIIFINRFFIFFNEYSVGGNILKLIKSVDIFIVLLISQIFSCIYFIIFQIVVELLGLMVNHSYFVLLLLYFFYCLNILLFWYLMVLGFLSGAHFKFLVFNFQFLLIFLHFLFLIFDNILFKFMYRWNIFLRQKMINAFILVIFFID